MEFILPTRDKPLHPHIAGKLIYELALGTVEGGEGRYNTWCYHVDMVYDTHRTLFAMRAKPLDDPDEDNNGDVSEGSVPFFMLVMVDPLIDDDDWISWRLIEEYAKLKNQAIGFYAGTDNLDLDRGELLNWEHGLDA
jgi:hypothetical protein